MLVPFEAQAKSARRSGEFVPDNGSGAAQPTSGGLEARDEDDGGHEDVGGIDNEDRSRGIIAGEGEADEEAAKDEEDVRYHETTPAECQAI